ncbi:MAG: hypothetical protein JKY37_16190 [Nannocystaceae bacterium]|nr:hypothetical protein [Nannocystaceae bacterium]
MRYIRICFGGESGEPGMTLYEIDAKGWVHRQVQLHAEGSRFSPEDILMCHPVVAAAMANHPAADEIDADEFEHMWKEVAADRPFCARIPDPSSPWAGQISSGNRVFDVAWAPDSTPAAGWECVPGFVNLFVRGKPEEARSACAAVFIVDAIDWYALTKAA